jgi:hypothetical protein
MEADHANLLRINLATVSAESSYGEAVSCIVAYDGDIKKHIPITNFIAWKYELGNFAAASSLE